MPVTASSGDILPCTMGEIVEVVEGLLEGVVVDPLLEPEVGRGLIEHFVSKTNLVHPGCGRWRCRRWRGGDLHRDGAGRGGDMYDQGRDS